jgi:hypothetical protein
MFNGRFIGIGLKDGAHRAWKHAKDIFFTSVIVKVPPRWLA